jgi:hypothetical protein
MTGGINSASLAFHHAQAPVDVVVAYMESASAAGSYTLSAPQLALAGTPASATTTIDSGTLRARRDRGAILVVRSAFIPIAPFRAIGAGHSCRRRSDEPLRFTDRKVGSPMRSSLPLWSDHAQSVAR